MSATGLKETVRSAVFTQTLEAAIRGDVIVANVYEALRQQRITPEECETILEAFEQAHKPAIWRAINRALLENLIKPFAGHANVDLPKPGSK